MHARGKVVKVVRTDGGSVRNLHNYERDLYFDKDVFSLLEHKDIKGKEDWLYSTITKSLKNRFDSFPLYISRIVYIADNTNSNFGYYQILCAAPGEVFQVTVDLQTATEKNDTSEEVKIKEPAPASDITFFPENLNPYNDGCQSTFELLKGYIQRLEKKKAEQHTKFWEGSITFSRSELEKPAIVSKTYNTTDYSLDEAVSLFPELSQVKDAIAITRQTREALTGFKKQVTTKLREANVVDETEAEKILEIFFGRLVSDTEKKLNSLEQELGLSDEASSVTLETDTSLLERIERDTKLPVINYKNAQAKLSNLKNAVAYAIYKAIYEYYVQEVQVATEGKPEERQKKIESFNKHFEMLGCIQIGEDGTLSDIGLVYNTIQNMSLQQITKFITGLLQNGESGSKEEGCDSSIFFNSKKLTKMITSINEAATDVSKQLYGDHVTQIGETKQPLFTAVGKTLGVNRQRFSIINPATFSWHPDVEAFEKEVNDQIFGIRQQLSQVTSLVEVTAESSQSASIKENRTKEERLKEERKKDYRRLQHKEDEMSSLAQDSTSLKNIVFSDEIGLVPVKFPQFSSFLSDYAPAKKMVYRAKDLCDILDKNKLELENIIQQLKEKVEVIKKFNESDSDPSVISDVEEIERIIAEEHKKLLQIDTAIRDYQRNMLSTLGKLLPSRIERKQQLENMKTDLEAIDTNLSRLVSIEPRSLKYNLQQLENTLLHQVETIESINEKKNNQKLYIQKRIKSALERLNREHLLPENLQVDEKDEGLAKLIVKYNEAKAKIKSLEETYQKDETGIDQIDEDVKTLEQTYNELVSVVSLVHDALNRRQVFAEILIKLNAFDKNVDIHKNPIHTDNINLITKLHDELKAEFEAKRLTETQYKKFQYHLDIFMATSGTLGNIYDEINQKHFDAEIIQEIFELQDTVDRKLSTYARELDAIKRFPELARFQRYLSRVNDLLLESGTREWRKEVETFKVTDKELESLVEKYDYYKKNILALIIKFRRCDMDIIQEEDINIADLNNRLTREYEAVYAYEQEIIKRVGYHTDRKKLSKFITNKVDPTINEFRKLVAGLKPDNDLLNSIISQYEANDRLVKRAIEGYQDQKLEDISKTTATVENLFQNSGLIFSKIEETLAFIAMQDGVFLETIPSKSVFTEQGVPAYFVANQHIILSSLIDEFDSKLQEFTKKYPDITLENIQDWTKEGRQILDTSYRLKKLRHELELSCGNERLSQLHTLIIYTEKTVKSYSERIKAKETSQAEKKELKGFLKLSIKDLAIYKQQYEDEKNAFYKKLKSKENPLAVSTSFYKGQVSAVIDVMESFSSKMSTSSSHVIRWLDKVESIFTQNLDYVVVPFAEKIPQRENSGGILKDKPASILPMESEVEVLKSPVVARVKKYEAARSDSAKEVFHDIMEINFDELEQVIEELANNGCYESPVPKQFLEVDKILQSDPIYEGYLSGAEIRGFDYDEFVKNIKHQVLYNKGTMTSAELIQAYNDDHIGLVALLNLNKIINPPKSGEIITLAALTSEINSYQHRGGKGIFRKLFGDTRTIRDLKLLRDAFIQDARKKGLKPEEVKIPVEDFELIFKLRNSRSSFTRKGSYQHRSLTLFKKGQDAIDEGNKPKKLSHTEEVIDHLRTSIQKGV